LDGDLDLLVGADDGSFSLYLNTGSAKSPELASAVGLVPPVERTSSRQPSKDVRRGMRSKICVTDWNENGLLDLLVGDFARQKPDLPEFTDEQKAEHEKMRKELETVSENYRTLSEKLHGKDRVRTKEQIEQIEKEQDDVFKHMMELRSKLPTEYERHGWVWLFLRKKI
jgi:hypothetical protein